MTIVVVVKRDKSRVIWLVALLAATQSPQETLAFLLLLQLLQLLRCLRTDHAYRAVRTFQLLIPATKLISKSFVSFFFSTTGTKYIYDISNHACNVFVEKV